MLFLYNLLYCSNKIQLNSSAAPQCPQSHLNSLHEIQDLFPALCSTALSACEGHFAWLLFPAYPADELPPISNTSWNIVCCLKSSR